MTKRVILLNDEPATLMGELATMLRVAGFAVASPDDEVRNAPLALVYGVVAGDRTNIIEALVRKATKRWSQVPVIACRLRSPDQEQSARRRLGNAALKRLGFHLIVEESAQLPALLHEIEGRAPLTELDEEEDEVSRAPEIPLPSALTADTLRAAFKLAAALHFADDQRHAAQITLEQLAALIAADRWTYYAAQDEGEKTILEPLLSFPRNETEEQSISEAALLAASRIEPASDDNRWAVPLLYGERVFGVIEVERATAPLLAEESELLAALAVPVGAAIARSVRVAEAERLSQTDDLTKLHNARFLRQYLIGEIKRARRYGSPVAALFLDLDDFKRVNDEHGHLVGSHVLMEMAAVILASVRDTDVVARYGGDEFVIILPETAAEQATRVAERVRARIAGHVFTGGRGLRLRLTASFGVASFPQHAQSPQQLLACADAAMYEAKAARKDCVRVAAMAAASDSQSENHAA